MAAEMVKKYHIALFVAENAQDGSEVWTRIKKSTAFDLNLNPETQDYDYITDENPTTELLRYKASLNQALTMYKGEDDYDFIFNKFFSLKTGSDAKCKVLIVFMKESTTETDDDSGESTTKYKAWRNEAVISISNLNSVDSTITFDINFGGTMDKGYAVPDESTKKPIFTKDSTGDSGWVDPFGA